jgi:hypothetical protein
VTFTAFGRADVAFLDFAEGVAAVIGCEISVVAFFGSDGDSVTALCDVAMDAVWADPTGFDLACGGATVTIDEVSVIAGSAEGAAARDFFARFTGCEADIAVFDLACGRATVIIVSVSVVACFT